MKKVLPVAVLSALAGVNGAQAVHVNSDGHGQVLLYPFYTTEGGQDTYINLVNTTGQAKAVKIRILESMNSQEVLDFNLYMSEYDHWSAVIYADPNGPGAVIRTQDTSCTVPLAISNGQAVKFRNYEYQSDLINNGLERTKEGYVEVIEMATLIGTSAADATHTTAGVPLDCQALDDAWDGGYWDTNPNTDTSAPSGGLYGYGVLIDVEEGTDATYDALALDNFFDLFGVHTDPGSLAPSLNDSITTYDLFDGANGAISGTAQNNRGIDAVSAVLMEAAIANDYVLEPSLNAGTDWVVTFPTKRDYVATDPAIPPFTAPWDPETTTSCESIDIRYWDREEQEEAPEGNDFSPRPPGPAAFALCWEANVMTFNGSDVLEGSDRSTVNLNLNSGFDNGWVRLTFSTATIGERQLVTQDHVFDGLPVIGFAVQKYVNESATTDEKLSNYAGLVTHKTQRSVSSVF